MDFDKIKGRIEELFSTQVKLGKQSKNINDFLACGQFINQQDLPQKGLHGIAAAIYVLSQNQIYNETTSKLCKYYENRNTFEDNAKVESDSNNTIKQAEFLFALSFVKAGITDVDNLKKQISTKLLDSIHNEQGWDYFMNNQTNAELLSTAFALKGLIKAGYYNKLNNVILYFRNRLKEDTKIGINNPTRLSIYVLCLYVLVFFDEDYPKYKSVYETIFKNIRKSKYFSLNNSYEQNLEYQVGDNNHYIRIPWQLYYLALSSEMNKWDYLNRNAQKRLSEVEKGILNGGFRYEFSGEHLSSRTYSIIYECFFIIKEHIPNSNLVIISNFINRIKPIFFIIFNIGIIALMTYSIYKWITKGLDFPDLAPEFIGYFAILYLTINNKSK